MTTKTEIKHWLRSAKLSRTWLADQCGVKKNTVNNWLSTKISIPERALIQIERLMARTEKELADSLEPTHQNLVLEVDVPTFERWSRAALKKGEIVTDYCHNAIEDAAHRDLHESKIERLPLAAEDPVQYRANLS